LYDRVGSVVGWDFSELERRTKTIGEKWVFLEIVKSYVTVEAILLDIGTGSGEKLLLIARFAGKAYGIDNSKNMLIAANRNLIKS